MNVHEQGPRVEVWRGGESFGKRKEQVEKLEVIGWRGFWRLIFLFKIQNLPNLGNSKIELKKRDFGGFI